ncbi:MAG: hypothetical protein IKF90_02520 [Parasporobacterium sp.]|nr:hypothetical protein [Parasporobacterium sp.]
MDIVRVPKSDCDCWIQDFGMGDNGNTEFGMSVYRASDLLLRHNRCLFHGAAILWQNKAWLFAADSGIGKSTQLKHWTQLYPDEVQIINGDKPILRLEENGSISVYPSPWKGKEEWGDDTLAAPLGGIIILKQGKENRIELLQPAACAARILSLFFSSFETKDIIEMLCRFEESLIDRNPVWRLTNLGDLNAAVLTHDTLSKWLEKNNWFN